MTNLFQDILNSALIGTERRPYTPAQGEGAAGTLIEALDAADGERALLGAAAVLAQYQRVGALPGKASKPLPDPAPDETLPRCSSASAQYLMTMLNGTYSDVLPEWLEAAAEAGKRVPEECLPSLLGVGVKNTALRETIIAVIGERGRWLAGLNKSWSYAAGSGGDDDDWQTATGTARLALLKRLRMADPDAARALVESAWTSEKADDRVEFIKCFSVGLSLADETFLESCLDDRSSKVVQVAAETLARLPGSQFQGRMIDRVQNRIMFKSGAKPRFDVLLWDEVDDAARRDTIGVVSLPDSSRLGEKSMLMIATLRLTPLTLWTDKWNKRPADLVALASKDDQWKNMLMNGWRMAAYLQGDVEWLAALMVHGLEIAHFTLDKMSAEAREKFILEVYDKDIFEEEKYRYFLFERCDHHWSRQLTEVAFELIIVQRKKKPDQRLPTFGAMVLMLAYHMPIDMIEAARSKIKPDDEAWERWQPLMLSTMEIVEFRRSMLEALSFDR